VTLGKLFKKAAERIAEGERDTTALVKEYTETVLADAHLTRQAVHQLVAKRIGDAMSSYMKPSGMTARVPAGQMSWLEMDPTAAVARMRSYIKDATARMARADHHAKVLGYIDASGLELTAFSTLAELCSAANVPEEYVIALTA